MRVRACTMRCRCHSSCRRSRFSQLGTLMGGKPSFSNKPRICCASFRSVFCLRRVCGVSRTHLPSTTRTAVPLAVVRTSVRVRWLPYLATRSRQSTVELLRPLAVRQPTATSALGFRYREKQFVESSDGNHIYSGRVGSFLPSPLVGLAPPTLLGYWSRHRHGMNYTNDPSGRRLRVSRVVDHITTVALLRPEPFWLDTAKSTGPTSL